MILDRRSFSYSFTLPYLCTSDHVQCTYKIKMYIYSNIHCACQRPRIQNLNNFLLLVFQNTKNNLKFLGYYLVFKLIHVQQGRLNL